MITNNKQATGNQAENVVLDNPCNRVKPPKTTLARDKIKFFTLEQTKLFLGALDAEYSTSYSAHNRIDDTGKAYHVSEYTETRTLPLQFKVFFHLALFCGLRRGEIVALEWSDFDFNACTVDITKSTSNINNQITTKTTKTASSVRNISVPASVMQLVREYRKQQLEYKLSLGSKWEGANYVFIQWNGKQMHPDSPYKTFKKIIKRYNESVECEENKLPEIPLHGLRHTSATLLISQNVDVKTVSSRLGHSNTSTTLDVYAHALKKKDTQASEILGNLLSKQA